jgi:arsenate reductase
MPYRVLFVCVHNSARSQMAEAFLNAMGGEHFEAESAGLEPGTMNPEVVTVMKEAAIDLSQKDTQSVFDLQRAGRSFDAVITVCDEANSEKCPVFPGSGKRIAWSFEDPSAFTGTREEILGKIRRIRDGIQIRVKDFIRESARSRN